MKPARDWIASPEDRLKADGWSREGCRYCHGAGKGYDQNDVLHTCPKCLGQGGLWKSPKGDLYRVFEGNNMSYGEPL